jgi:hypothetical protein
MYDKYFDAVVLSRRGFNDRIAEFRIGAADGAPLPMAKAGSHIELRFGGEDGRFLRHYSVVGPLTLSDEPEPFCRATRGPSLLEPRPRTPVFSATAMTRSWFLLRRWPS